MVWLIKNIVFGIIAGLMAIVTMFGYSYLTRHNEIRIEINNACDSGKKFIIGQAWKGQNRHYFPGVIINPCEKKEIMFDGSEEIIFTIAVEEYHDPVY